MSACGWAKENRASESENGGIRRDDCEQEGKAMFGVVQCCCLYTRPVDKKRTLCSQNVVLARHLVHWLQSQPRLIPPTLHVVLHHWPRSTTVTWGPSTRRSYWIRDWQRRCDLVRCDTQFESRFRYCRYEVTVCVCVCVCVCDSYVGGAPP